MQNYDYIQTVGEGAYGEVWQCRDKITGRVVAVKGFKAAHEDKDIMRLAMREAKMLEAVSHENLVRLITAFKSKSGRVYMVFDYAGSSVQSVMERAGGGLGAAATKLLSWQLLQAAAHLHGNKVLHRDIKPANILVDSSGVAKLCDFGFARAVRCGPREAQRCTSYVVTRWYRAPEVLVSDEYGAASDIWSVGCSIAEFAVGRALFPGSSTADQLWRIMRCFGPLPPGLSMRMAADPRLRSLCAPQPLSRNLRQRLPEVEPRLLELVAACLRLDPAARPTAAELLQMPYFWDVPKLIAGTQLAAALAAERREAARMMAARLAAKAAAAIAAGSDGGGGAGTVPPAPAAAATAAAAAAGVGSSQRPQQQRAPAAPSRCDRAPSAAATPTAAAAGSDDGGGDSAMMVDKPQTPATPPAAADAAATAASAAAEVADAAALKAADSSSSMAAVGGAVLQPTAHVPVSAAAAVAMATADRPPSAGDKAMMVAAAAFSLAPAAASTQRAPSAVAAAPAAVTAAPVCGVQQDVNVVDACSARGAAAADAAPGAGVYALAAAAAAAGAAEAAADAGRSRSNCRQLRSISATVTDLGAVMVEGGGAVDLDAFKARAAVATSAHRRRRSALVVQQPYECTTAVMGSCQQQLLPPPTAGHPDDVMHAAASMLLPGALLSESGTPNAAATAAAEEARCLQRRPQHAPPSQQYPQDLLSPATPAAAAVELPGSSGIAGGSGRLMVATALSTHCGVEGTSMLFDGGGGGSGRRWLSSTVLGVAADGSTHASAPTGGANVTAAGACSGTSSPHGGFFLGVHAASSSCLLPKAGPAGGSITDSPAAAASLAGAAKGCSGGAAAVAGAGRLFGTANLLNYAAVPQSLHSGMRSQRRRSLRHMDSGGGLYTTTEVFWDEVGTPVGAPMLRADPGALLPHVRPPHGAPYQVPPPGCQSTVNSTTGSSSFLLPLYNGELQADMEAAATGGGGGVPSFTSTVHNGGSSRASGRLTSAAVRRSLTAGGGSESLGDIVEAVEVNNEAVDGTGGSGDAGAAAAGRGGGGGSGNDRRKKSWLLSLRIPEDGRTAGLSGQVGAGITPGGAAGGGGGGGRRRSGLIASLVGLMMGGSGSAAGGGVVSSAGDLSPDLALVLPGGGEHSTPRNGVPDAHDPILSPDGDGVWGRHGGAATYTSSTPASRASGGLQQQQQQQQQPRQIHSHNSHYSRSQSSQLPAAASQRQPDQQQQERRRLNWRGGSATAGIGPGSHPTTAAGTQQQRPQQNMQSSSLTDSPLSPTSPGGLQQQLKAAAASAASVAAGITQEQQAYAQQQQQQQPLIGRSFSSTLGQAVSSRAMSRLRAAATAASGGVGGLSSSGHLGSSMPRTPPPQQQPPTSRGPNDIPLQRTCRSVQSQPLPAWGVEQATMAAAAGASAAGGGGGSGRFAGGYTAAVSGRTGLRQDPSATMLLPVPASAAIAAVPGVDVRGSDWGSSSLVIPTVSNTITAEGLPRAMGSGGQSRCSLPTIVPAPAAIATGSGTLPAASPVASGAAAPRQLLTSGGSRRDTEEEASQSLSQQVVLLPPPRPTSAATARVVPYGGPMAGVAAPAVPVHHVASGVPGDGGVSSGTAAATSAAYFSGDGMAAGLGAQADLRQQLQPRHQPGKPERSSGGGLSRIVRAFKSAIKGKK